MNPRLVDVFEKSVGILKSDPRVLAGYMTDSGGPGEIRKRLFRRIRRMFYLRRTSLPVAADLAIPSRILTRLTFSSPDAIIFRLGFRTQLMKCS